MVQFQDVMHKIKVVWNEILSSFALIEDINTTFRLCASVHALHKLAPPPPPLMCRRRDALDFLS